MEQKEMKNKMGTMPVGRLMLSMGIPMVLSMMLQAVYNIVDSAFISNSKSGGGECDFRSAFDLWLAGIAGNGCKGRRLCNGNRSD